VLPHLVNHKEAIASSDWAFDTQNPPSPGLGAHLMEPTTGHKCT